MADVNTLTDAGLAIKAQVLSGALPATYRIRWGTGTGTPTAGMTALFTAAPESPVACTNSVITSSIANDTASYVAAITASASRTITEAGLEHTSGVLVEHRLLDAGSPFVLTTGEAVTFTFKDEQRSTCP